MFRKPGPAISMASTQRVKAGVASSADLSCSPKARGLSLSGLASCMAAGQAKSPRAATLGDSNAALAPAPGDSTSSSAASAASNSFLAVSIGGFYGAGPGRSPSMPPAPPKQPCAASTQQIVKNHGLACGVSAPD